MVDSAQAFPSAWGRWSGDYPRDDTALLDRLRAGDDSALSALHERHVRVVHGVVTDLVIDVRQGAGVADAVGYQIDPVDSFRDSSDHVLLPLPDTLAVTGDNLVVPAAATEYVRNDLAGFGAAVVVVRRVLQQLAHRVPAPHEAALLGKVDLGVGGVVEPVRPQVEMRRQRLQRRLFQRLGFLPGGILILTEPESLESTDEFAFDGHFTLVVHLGQEGLLLLQPAKQH